MTSTRILSGVALAIMTATATPSFSQTTGGAFPPAETPPAGFSERQYVDSRGCLFVRAEIGGRVQWIPQLSRDRTPVCNRTPSIAAKPETSAPVVVEAPTQAPAAGSAEQTALAAPAKTTAVPKTINRKPSKTRRVTRSAPRAVAPPPPVPEPRIFVVRRKGPSPAPPPTVVSSGRYTKGAGGAQPSAIPASGFDPVRAGLPETLPPGFKTAFGDDRNNPLRGQGTAQGQRQMELIWTNTVPRRLVERETGRDVTASYPQLSPPPQSGYRYVQVGAFAVPSNASRASSALQRNGLPVTVTRARSGGKPVQIVMAGPFSSNAQVQSALSKVRRSGYRDAFVRR